MKYSRRVRAVKLIRTTKGCNCSFKPLRQSGGMHLKARVSRLVKLVEEKRIVVGMIATAFDIRWQVGTCIVLIGNGEDYYAESDQR